MILGIRGIEESPVYQDICAQGESRGEAKGRAEEARLALLRLGRKKKLGELDEGACRQIEAIDNVDRRNSLLERILDVASWNELFSQPGRND
jgi:predicted transposase YdaD